MTASLDRDIDGVLFDLDGTLVDSAPDLYAALLAQCEEEGVAPPPYAPVRQVVSSGSRSILRTAFGDRGEIAIDALVPRYLALYQRVLGEQTVLFDGIDLLLAKIENLGLRWGVVTNKPGFLAAEVLAGLGWDTRASALVSGDTLRVKKPDPAPVLLACEQSGLAPSRGLFVGDDRRDIEAGRAAGLATVAVSWGYLDGGDPHGWGADLVLDQPSQLADLLRARTVAA